MDISSWERLVSWNPTWNSIAYECEENMESIESQSVLVVVEDKTCPMIESGREETSKLRTNWSVLVHEGKRDLVYVGHRKLTQEIVKDKEENHQHSNRDPDL